MNLHRLGLMPRSAAMILVGYNRIPEPFRLFFGHCPFCCQRANKGVAGLIALSISHAPLGSNSWSPRLEIVPCPRMRDRGCHIAFSSIDPRAKRRMNFHVHILSLCRRDTADCCCPCTVFLHIGGFPDRSRSARPAEGPSVGCGPENAISCPPVDVNQLAPSRSSRAERPLSQAGRGAVSGSRAELRH
jgi:hypothetical protein